MCWNVSIASLLHTIRTLQMRAHQWQRLCCKAGLHSALTGFIQSCQECRHQLDGSVLLFMGPSCGTVCYILSMTSVRNIFLLVMNTTGLAFLWIWRHLQCLILIYSLQRVARLRYGTGNEDRCREVPLVVYTQTRESSNGVSLTQLIQADNTLLFVLDQNILCQTQPSSNVVYNLFTFLLLAYILAHKPKIVRIFWMVVSADDFRLNFDDKALGVGLYVGHATMPHSHTLTVRVSTAWTIH